MLGQDCTVRNKTGKILQVTFPELATLSPEHFPLSFTRNEARMAGFNLHRNGGQFRGIQKEQWRVSVFRGLSCFKGVDRSNQDWVRPIQTQKRIILVFSSPRFLERNLTPLGSDWKTGRVPS